MFRKSILTWVLPVFGLAACFLLYGAFSTSGGLGVAAAEACACQGTFDPSSLSTYAGPTANPSLTACVFNPTSPVTGTVDATGCDIGVYYSPGNSGSVSATIENANYFGVLVNGAAVNVTDSKFKNIGPSSNTYGNVQYRAGGIFYINGATGKIQNNMITQPLWGKFGITAKNPGTMVKITGNTVTGYGADGGIAQNGIELGDGAAGTITGGNKVSKNLYTGTDANATGIIIYGGPGYEGLGVFEGSNYTIDVKVSDNTLTDNDQGVWLSNLSDPASDAPTPTDNKVSGNTVTNSASCNVFAAGIVEESGNGDAITGNNVYGSCY